MTARCFLTHMLCYAVLRHRWRLLPSEGERRAVFDEFCKNIAMEQKELAATAQRQSVDGFR